MKKEIWYAYKAFTPCCFVSYSIILSDIVGFVGFVLCIEKMFFFAAFLSLVRCVAFYCTCAVAACGFLIFALSEIGLLTLAEDVSVFHSYFRVQNWVSKVVSLKNKSPLKFKRF